MKKINKYFALGCFFSGVSLFINRFRMHTDLLQGLCAGIGIAFTSIGVITTKYDISKLRSWKINFIKKCVGKG